MQCAQCHANGNYNLTVTTCVSCHLKDFQGTNNPNHTTAGFPQQCEVCHTTSNWNATIFQSRLYRMAADGRSFRTAVQPVSYATATTTLLIRLASAAISMISRARTIPNHVPSGFPQQCDVCHSTAAWSPASFNHNNTGFPLTGAHTSVACASCHVNNNYTTVPTDCFSCHKADYQATNNPNHVSAGFPTTCATCHTTRVGWARPSITPGSRRITAMQMECARHATPTQSNYGIFQCTNCHTKSNTDGDHRNVSGYVYNSVNCYQCHRNGGGG